MNNTNKLIGVIACYSNISLYHEMGNDGTLGPGTNLTMENIKKIFRFTAKERKSTLMKFKGLIPENVLHFDAFDGSIVFYTKPSFRMIIFRNDLEIKNAYYKIPYLLWVYKNRRLSVFALKKKPKDENEELFNAPFMNISENGNVCMGNVKYANEKYVFDYLMEDIVEKFFASEFTHTSHNNLVNMNYQKFLEQYANDKNLSYSKLLVPSKKSTIKNIL